MATLSPPFILCPLPDRKTLLGTRPDRTPNKAIITLGRNIAIRYHVPEQKQECTWTTSRYWFTSPVIYCFDYGKYGAVLNNNIVALWDEGDSSLSNMNKLKLPVNIHGLHSSQSGRTLIILKNGHVAYLSEISEDKNRVKASFLGPEETVVNFEVDDKNLLCYLVSKHVKNDKAISVSVVEIENKSSRKKVNIIGTESQEILGYCMSAQDAEDSYLAFLDGDGFLYKRKIMEEAGEPECCRLANLNKSLSTTNPVVMCPLPDNSCIAMYGCDPSEEGAVVIIYDVHYDLIVSKQSLKLYSIPPLMERIGSSLFVPLGLHILVLTFRLTKSLLSTVVGKHQARINEEVFEGRNPWISNGWNTSSASDVINEVLDIDFQFKKKDSEDLKKKYPEIWEIVQQVQIFEAEGQPEAVICNHVIPVALEKANGSALDWILDTFLDVPEVHIVSIVIFFLKEVGDSIECATNERLNKLLLRKFDKNLLTSSLRHVAYDDIKKLLSYINCLIKTKWHLDMDADENPMESWLKWCSALIDAHYTKFVLHNDTCIIETMLDSLSECTEIMKDVEDMEPFLLMTYSKTSFEPEVHALKRWRTETVTFE